ncbi:hypothetical protein ACVINW_003554 [Bradyrhizobium sp. USDA 4461]
MGHALITDPPKARVATDLWPVRAVQYIDRNGAAGSRDTGTDLFVRVLLLLAEENVAVVEITVDFDEIDGADAAFAAPAIRNHLATSLIEHVQQ